MTQLAHSESEGPKTKVHQRRARWSKKGRKRKNRMTRPRKPHPSANKRKRGKRKPPSDDENKAVYRPTSITPEERNQVLLVSIVL